MIYTWLSQRASESLIVFYNGWGMDEKAVGGLDSKGYDICACHDFRVMPDSIPEAWAGYKKITVVAWSLGVLAADIHLSKVKAPISRAIAINGTIAPINDSHGIPEDVYWKTHHGLNETTREKFFRRMCGDKASYERFKRIQPQRGIDEQKEELAALADHSLDYADIYPGWRFVITGKRDRIFPYANQRNFWSLHPQLVIRDLELPHFPFFYWNSWDDLIKCAIGV